MVLHVSLQDRDGDSSLQLQQVGRSLRSLSSDLSRDGGTWLSPSGFWWDARTELLWSIFKALRQEDIDVPFDQLTVWFGEEDAAKLQSSLAEGTDMTVEEILGKSEKAPENANQGRV